MYGMDEADCSFNNLLVRADCETTAVLPVYELDKVSNHSYIMCIHTHRHTHLKHYKYNFQRITQAWSVFVS